MSDSDRTKRIRELNDQFRKDPLRRGRLMITSGVDGNGIGFSVLALSAVQAFNTFTEENDPHGEHDFGSFEVIGHKLFWKIDYFQKGSNREAGAETPENALTTDRVLTIMLAEEY
jgi:hypothetical protein